MSPRGEDGGARRVLGGSVYVAVGVALAAVAAWPIYASASFALAAGVGALAGAAVVAVATWRRWGAGAIAALLAGVFVLASVPLAVPARLGGPADLLRGLGEAFAGVLFAWKDLVTVDLPVGAYRNLLIPALVVFLVGTAVALRLAWRADRWATAAVPVVLAMLGFGLFFGRTAVSAPLVLGPLTWYAPVETVLGAGGLAAGVLWLAWRSRDERLQALARATAASGVRMSRRPTRTDRRRVALGAGMLVTALVAAVAVVPWAARGADRDVLRSATGPDRQLAAAVSPLAQYRTLFEDERADAVMFRVSAEPGAAPERIRVAVLDAYDGETFRAGADGPSTPYVRVPSVRDAGTGSAVGIRVEIDAWDTIWTPTAGRLASVSFDGDRAAALADRFYYSAADDAGVDVAGGGLRTGDAYRLRAVEPALPDVSGLAAPGGDLGGVEPPENLRAWVAEHATGSGGAALSGLVDLLRERGYLSHALSIDAAQPPSWVAERPGYAFQPSAAGHSLARVDQLFARLLEREGDPRAAASGNYVAAVGDDEQFAVAVALIAKELGFPARVVLGARLSSSDAALPTCEDGVCRGRDLAAWTEVRDDDGTWVPLDVTPQAEQSPSLEVTQQRDPENVTEVRPDAVDEVVPPEPVQEDSARDDDGPDAGGWDLAWLWPVVRIGGIVLLVLAVVLGPFLAILAAKAARRRARRRAAPVSAIAGGWDEYVDAGVDAGRHSPRAATRGEIAAAFGTASGALLAERADRAVFSRESTSEADAAEFWRIVEEERRAMARERGVWRRIRAAVSLRSFVRVVAPQASQRVMRIVERGRRRAGGRGRETS
ncbi:transglutaminase domain-containing protein [Microbacterium sp. 10M-3C3]|uniref:transglutaminase domain-containing protein n=1 Tax=Microbacterium sp. 10M-3C3 TaxID=2483401 RepID=UPI001F0BEC60|nr:transglutaminase domain-containing protein [Microbacterium sp. 10M-3C3]